MRSNETAFSSSEAAEIVEEYGELVTFKSAEKITTVSRRTLGRYVADGKLKLYRVGTGRAPRFKTRDLLNMIERVA